MPHLQMLFLMMTTRFNLKGDTRQRTRRHSELTSRNNCLTTGHTRDLTSSNPSTEYISSELLAWRSFPKPRLVKYQAVRSTWWRLAIFLRDCLATALSGRHTHHVQSPTCLPLRSAHQRMLSCQNILLFSAPTSREVCSHLFSSWGNLGFRQQRCGPTRPTVRSPRWGFDFDCRNTDHIDLP